MLASAQPRTLGHYCGELQSYLTLKHGETLNESGMAVRAHDPCSDERRQFGSRVVLVGKFDNRGPLASDWISSRSRQLGSGRGPVEALAA